MIYPFGVDLDSPRGAASFMAASRKILDRPGRVMWITAQGRFSDVRERPLGLRPGVARLKIELKYNEGEPVIKEITRVSKPGRRVYSKIQNLQKVYGGLGISILSTPRGVMSDSEARAQNVGGEVLCNVI